MTSSSSSGFLTNIQSGCQQMPTTAQREQKSALILDLSRIVFPWNSPSSLQAESIKTLQKSKSRPREIAAFSRHVQAEKGERLIEKVLICIYTLSMGGGIPTAPSTLSKRMPNHMSEEKASTPPLLFIFICTIFKEELNNISVGPKLPKF